jgi:Uma2 family endonuclease
MTARYDRDRLNLQEYFGLPEKPTPMELVYGVVREPPAPRYGHQALLTRLGALMYAHVREHDLGDVCVSPVDVVLDQRGALVLQPDLVFVARDRRHIIKDRIWGAPDLVVEVLSRGTAHRDRTLKTVWYEQFGVTECWLVERHAMAVEVIAFGTGRRERFTGDEAIVSDVLPSWRPPARALFDEPNEVAIRRRATGAAPRAR